MNKEIPRTTVGLLLIEMVLLTVHCNTIQIRYDTLYFTCIQGWRIATLICRTEAKTKRVMKRTKIKQEISSCWDARPFGHYRHGPKSEVCYVPFVGEAGSSPNAMLPRPRHTSIPSDILIHTMVWPQYTGCIVTKRLDGSRCHLVWMFTPTLQSFTDRYVVVKRIAVIEFGVN